MNHAIEARLNAAGQAHLLQFGSELNAVQRQSLQAQIEGIDLDLIARLYRQTDAAQDWSEMARRAEPPPAIRLNQTVASETMTAALRGRAALDGGQIGVVLVAGGQGTRLGFDAPKGIYPIGPVSGASLFQILLEKVAATAQRHGRSIPLFVMTSPATHVATIEYLEASNRFGLPAEDVQVFCQGTMPAVDIKSGKLLLAEKDQLALSPDGHGGMLSAFARCGGFETCQRRGIEQLFYMQIDNPLVSVCDSEFIGHHLIARSELSTQVVAKQNPLDRVGNVVTVAGRMMIIEYSDLPNDVAELRNPDGTLKLWAGNIAVHLAEVAFLRRMVESADSLPFHIAKKKVAYIDELGQRIEPEQPNAIKFERFIFDLIPAAERSLVVEVDATKEFAPLKNAAGEPKDSPETVRAQMIALHRNWLELAGFVVDAGVAVEISPRFALDAEEVAAKVATQGLTTELHVTQPRYFC
ncbi:MAG: UTP--glucose-1-phosphate uridylyltransferase [Planctomycetota bacterium]|nr:UTP--glucose-1-phosphate uridylyltransferase [Planctomycetota bacterium]